MIFPMDRYSAIFIFFCDYSFSSKTMCFASIESYTAVSNLLYTSLNYFLNQTIIWMDQKSKDRRKTLHLILLIISVENMSDRTLRLAFFVRFPFDFNFGHLTIICLYQREANLFIAIFSSLVKSVKGGTM